MVIFLKNCFVVTVCCYFRNDVLSNYAFGQSTKFPWNNTSRRNTAFIKKKEVEFMLPFPFFPLSFWISLGFWENDSFENGCKRKLTTARNIVISPNFLVWNFCGKAQFPHSFGRFARLLGGSRCNGELRRLRFKTSPVLIHRWISTAPALILRWNKDPPVN